MNKNKKQQIKTRILDFKNACRNNLLQTATYATLGAGLAGAGYSGWQHWRPQADEYIINTQDNSRPAAIIPPANGSADFNDFRAFLTFNGNPFLSTGQTEPTFNLADAYKEGEDYRSQIPLIENDALKNVPNIDFFNYCFNRSNKPRKNTKYGITTLLYNKFHKLFPVLRALHGIKGYNSLNFDQARVVAKASVYDLYDIGYIQNPSIAAYLYHTFMTKGCTPGHMRAIANAASDISELYGTPLNQQQSAALKLLASNYDDSKLSLWRTAISVINGFSDKAEAEYTLFMAIKDNIFELEASKTSMEPRILNKLREENTAFTFEPTLKPITAANTGVYADLPLAKPLTENEQNALIRRAQKDKDLETFKNIYMQCSYNNYLNLTYGNKQKTFKEADKALANYEVDGKIHRGLYCAGMSMASFCQAADIFITENPESYVSGALTKFLDNCRNVHSCLTLMHDLGRNAVIKSRNLEKDVKAYMKTHSNAILFAWTNRGGGNYHHQTLFPAAEVASNDAYTYCAYNNDHWSNEQQMSKYMNTAPNRSGYFSDIGSQLDTLASRLLAKDMQNQQTPQQQPQQPAIMMMNNKRRQR